MSFHTPPPLLIKFKNFDGEIIYINAVQVLCVCKSSEEGNTIIYVKDGSQEYYEVIENVESVVQRLTAEAMC